VVFEAGGTITPTTSPFPDGANVSYAIKTGSTALPTGITLDTGTGAVTIATTTVVQAPTTYTIEAKPTSANYTGTKDATIKITITAKSIAGYTLTYADTSVVFEAGGTIAPTTSPFPDGANVSYAIKTGSTALPTGITLNTGTGAVTIATTTVVQAPTTYTIEAKPTSANYTTAPVPVFNVMPVGNAVDPVFIA
jgi:predicted RNA methylase